MAISKKDEVLSFLKENVFNPVLMSGTASIPLKRGIRLTVTRLGQLDAEGIVKYYWSAIIGTQRSVNFATMMRNEGFTRFEEIIEEFRVRFDDDWLRK